MEEGVHECESVSFVFPSHAFVVFFGCKFCSVLEKGFVDTKVDARLVM